MTASNRSAKDVFLAPSLLSCDWWRAGEQIEELKAAGVEWLHFDAMDGHFVPNLSFGALFMERLRDRCDLHFDAHLMVEQPENRVPEFLKAGAQSISVHVEGNAHLHRLIHQIKDGGALAGAVLNPATPVESLSVVLPDLDFVLVMSVNPGFGGQKFLPLALRKMEQLAQLRAELGLNFLIEVDGGVGFDNTTEIVRAGADVLVAGSSLFSPQRTLRENVEMMRRAVEAAFVVEV